MLIARYPGGENPTRRALGDYPSTTLEGGPGEGRKWRTLIKHGIDPALAEERERQANLRKQENTFAAVAEAWFQDKLPGERKGREVERDVRNAFLRRRAWGAATDHGCHRPRRPDGHQCEEEKRTVASTQFAGACKAAFRMGG